MRVCYGAVSMTKLCRLFGKTRQAYFKQINSSQKKEIRNALVISKIKEIRKDSYRMGAVKLRSILCKEFGPLMKGLGRDAFFTMCRENNLLVKVKRRHAIYTQSNHRFHKWPDLIQRVHPTRPEQTWVSDITYVRIYGRWLYLSLVTDAYSRKIRGYNLSHSPSVKSCLSALNMALQGRKYPHHELTHHSDRGIQYCSKMYVKALQDHAIQISMTQSGSPYDNAIAERLNGILKSEYRMGENFPSYGEALKQLISAVHTYNTFRPHYSIDLLTPQEAHQDWVVEIPQGLFQTTSLNEPILAPSMLQRKTEKC
jgi:putative transposase